MSEVLKKGCLAYLDSFAGLVPCTVLSITGPSGRASTQQKVRFEVTETVGAYKAGDQDESSSNWVVPRKAIRYSKLGLARVLPYRVEGDRADERRA